MCEIVVKSNFTAKTMNSVKFKQILTLQWKCIVQDYWDFPGSKFPLMLKMLTKGHLSYQGGPDQFVQILFQSLIHICIHPASFLYKTLPNKMMLSIHTSYADQCQIYVASCLYLQGKSPNTMKAWKPSRHFVWDGNTHSFGIEILDRCSGTVTETSYFPLNSTSKHTASLSHN